MTEVKLAIKDRNILRPIEVKAVTGSLDHLLRVESRAAYLCLNVLPSVKFLLLFSVVLNTCLPGAHQASAFLLFTK